MASEIQNELAAFHQFVGQQLAADAPLSPEACLQQWRALHPAGSELHRSVAAVKRAIEQADSGEGRLLEVFDREFRNKHGLPQDA